MPEEVAENSIFEDDDKGITVTPDIKVENLGHQMPLGMELNDEELYELASREKTYIVYVMGPIHSGKSTFEAMMYEQFLHSSVGEIMFSGSDTLLSFERLLNSLRANNGKSSVDMPRTNEKKEQAYLHLKLYDKKLNRKINVIMADKSGETFERCKSNVEVLQNEYHFLNVAERVLIFVDGEKLCDFSERIKATQNVFMVLNTIKSSNQYHSKFKVDIVISKNDYLCKNIDKGNTIEFLEDFKRRIDLQNDFFTINLVKVESLSRLNLKDPDNSISLSEYLKSWVKEHKSPNDYKCLPFDVESFRSEFDKYISRWNI